MASWEYVDLMIPSDGLGNAKRHLKDIIEIHGRINHSNSISLDTKGKAEIEKMKEALIRVEECLSECGDPSMFVNGILTRLPLEVTKEMKDYVYTERDGTNENDRQIIGDIIDEFTVKGYLSVHIINQYGADGWEVVSHKYIREYGDRYVLKRKLG